MSTAKPTQTFCSLPFTNLSVEANGNLRVCCNIENYSHNLKAENIQGLTDATQLLNSPLHKEIRSAILQNKRHSACVRCWRAEDSGGLSYRQMFNNLYQNKILSELVGCVAPDGTLPENKIFYADLTLGNTCSLRCRMCHPHSSHLWINEAKQFNLFGLDSIDFNNLSSLDWFSGAQSQQLVKQCFQFVDRLNFLGGEPFLIKEHLSLLTHLVEIKKAPDVELQYNTNLTFLPLELKQLWSHFKSVEINLSCDASPTLNEYIRFPLNAKNWQQNVLLLLDWKKSLPLIISLHSTFQVLNATRTFEFCKWAWEFSENLGLPRVPFFIYVSHPQYFDVQILPRDLKSLAAQSFNEALNFYSKKTLTPLEANWVQILTGHAKALEKSPANQELLWKRFIQVTQQIDSSRNQNILAVLPEFKTYF